MSTFVRLALVALTLLCGCLPARHGHVRVPRTSDRAFLCLGTCNRIAAECRYMERSLSLDEPGSRWSCDRDQEDCLLACPGASWVEQGESARERTRAARVKEEAAARECRDGGEAEASEDDGGEAQ